jgi:hypothetical protein
MPRLLILALLLGGVAGAHSRLTAPVPRNDFDDIKDTNALHPPPCGGPRSTVVMAKQAGDVIQVEWDETIDHLGHYEILFSMANDQNFTFLNDPTGIPLTNIRDVQGGTLPHHYTQMVKLPAAACPACTLQLKQFMSETSTYYHSCADVQLLQVTAPSDGGAPPDLAPLPAPAMVMPSMPPQPSAPPVAMDAPPDMATAVPAGGIEVDYSYGCEMSGNATISFLALLLVALLAARLRA